MVASCYVCFIALAGIAAVAGAGGDQENCFVAAPRDAAASCSSAATVSLGMVAGNAQLQSTARLKRGQHATSVPASLASIGRRSRSKQAMLRTATAEVRRGAARMRTKWDGSMQEIDKMIRGIAEHDSESEDSCSVQLIEYKSKLKKIHESTLAMSVEVDSTSSQVSIFEKECEEKDEELKQIEVVHSKRVKKCATERRVQRKTLETLQSDRREMRKISKAHVRLKASDAGTGKPQLFLAENVATAPKHHSLREVRGMVKKTKHAAAKVRSCLAKAHLAKGGNESVALDSIPRHGMTTPLVEQQCDERMKPRCYPVSCMADGWVCGETVSCPTSMPRCHPISCMVGRWQCGAESDPAYVACQGRGRGDACRFALPNSVGETPGFCVVTQVASFKLGLFAEDAKTNMGSKDIAAVDDNDDDNDDVSSELRTEDDVSEHPGDIKDDEVEEEDNNTEEPVKVLLREAVSPFPVSPVPQPETALKCVPVGTVTECQEVVVALEHQFSESYVSLTRMIEEYEVVSHSTVCEETVEEEYTQESSAVQDEANKVCKSVQGAMTKLEKYKFEYQSTIQIEHKMQTAVKTLTKHCGSLSSTEEYLGSVSTTLDALGDCPGLGEVHFQLPTWVGDWVKFEQNRDRGNKWNDNAMLEACVQRFGHGVRVAEVSEIDGRSIEGMPDVNTAEFPLLGACPSCRGRSMPGLSKTGRGRICWDAGAALTRVDRSRDCAGGPRAVLCVYDAATVHD